MKKVFIVNTEDGTRVISANVLAKDIQEIIKENGFTEVKRKDVELFAEETVQENFGKAISYLEYKPALKQYVDCLVEYTKLTPYQFFMHYTQGR